jgi:hypothetical protein
LLLFFKKEGLPFERKSDALAGLTNASAPSGGRAVPDSFCTYIPLMRAARGVIKFPYEFHRQLNHPHIDECCGAAGIS